MNPNLEELACLYVLDRLDAGARESFAARLAHDPELAARVRDLEAALARRIRALPQTEPPAGLLTGIEAQLAAEPAGAASAPAGVRAPTWRRLVGWGMAAAIALGAGALAVRHWRPAGKGERPVLLVVGLDPGRSRSAELTMRTRAPDADARFIELATLAEQFWDKSDSLPGKVDDVARTDPGYALFDPGTNEGFIAIRQLPDGGTDQRYRLWIVDTASGRVRDAGILPLAGADRGLYFFSVTAAAAKPDRLDFFVTAEDSAAPDSQVPRGRVILGAKPI